MAMAGFRANVAENGTGMGRIPPYEARKVYIYLQKMK
jgi:hypothetical protein